MRYETSAALEWTELSYALLRIVSGALFVFHGAQKLFGAVGGQQAQLGSMMGAAGLIETVAGTLILLGLFTTAAAFIASGEMAAAYFMAHAPQGALPIQNGGELAVLYCFLFLYLAVRGDGRFSIGSVLATTRFTRRLA